MADEEWYRSPNWTRADQNLFERKLRRARRHNQPQYLRLKASALLDAGDFVRPDASYSLLFRVLQEYSDANAFDVTETHEILARAYEEDGSFEKAEDHYRAALRASQELGYTPGRSELRLAELFVRTEQVQKYAEVKALLDELGVLGILESDRYRYSIVQARLAYRLGKRQEAAEHARQALAIAEVDRMQFARHPDVGRVQADRLTLEEMRVLAQQRVEDQKDPVATPTTVDEWIEALRKRDPVYRQEAARDSDWARMVAREYMDAAPMVRALHQAGLPVDTISDLFTADFDYREAIPILLEWLPKVGNLTVKEQVVRALSSKWATSVAAGPLIAEFRKAPNSPNRIGGLKWAIGNALSVVADDSVFNEIVELALDRRHGWEREILADAIGRMHNPEKVHVLIQLLGDRDREVVRRATRVLGKKKAVEAREYLAPLLEHPDENVRQEVVIALTRMDQAKRA